MKAFLSNIEILIRFLIYMALSFKNHELTFKIHRQLSEYYQGIAENWGQFCVFAIKRVIGIWPISRRSKITKIHKNRAKIWWRLYEVLTYYVRTFLNLHNLPPDEKVPEVSTDAVVESVTVTDELASALEMVRCMVVDSNDSSIKCLAVAMRNLIIS